MIQDKMVRARRQYHHHHHHHHNHHHQPQQQQQQQPAHQHHHEQQPHQQLHHNQRHALNNFHRGSSKRHSAPSAPLNTTQFIMNDHELIEPDFDLMHNAIMEHYNKSKKRKLQHEQQGDEASDNTSSGSPEKVVAKSATDAVTAAEAVSDTSSASFCCGKSVAQKLQRQVAAGAVKSPLKDLDDEEAKNQQQQPSNLRRSQQQQQQQHHLQNDEKYHHLERQTTPITTTTTPTTTPGSQLQESTNQSNPTTPNYRPTGSPGDEDGLSPFINHEHLQNEFQEVYANIHTERLSSMSKHQLVDKYLLLEERVEELENQLRESKTITAASHG